MLSIDVKYFQTIRRRAMLFLLADFIDVLITRVLKFLNKKKDESSVDYGKAPSNFVVPYDLGLQDDQVQEQLDAYAKLFPPRAGDTCTCIVRKGSNSTENIAVKNGCSKKACKALKISVGDKYLVECAA
jgi:hypothetical protein